MRMRGFSKAMVGIVCLSFLLSGCATTGENTAGRTTGTAVGALGGALVGYKQGGLKGAVLGALIGGATGYALGWLVDDYTAKKTKSAQQVREQYAQSAEAQAGKGEAQEMPEDREPAKEGGAVRETTEPPSMPQVPEIHAYNIAVNPDDTLLRGKDGEIVSRFDLLAGNGSEVKVEEDRAILSPDGKELLKKRYVYREVDGTGGYEFSAKFPVPKGVEQGRYSIASTLYVNGKEASSANYGFQVVDRGTERNLASR